jgi:hypothetical protein
MRTSSLLVTFIVLATPAIVHADPANSVGVTLGLASPVGEIGVDVDHRFTRMFDLDVGAGEALGGPQVSAMPRLRFGSQAVSGTLGAGLSAGPMETFGLIDDTDARMSTFALLANIELGAQLTSQGGMFVRGFIGGSVMLANTGWTCTANCDGFKNEPSASPYLGLTVGHDW